MFHCNLTCFRAFQPVESLKFAMEKTIMKWTEGKSKGALFLHFYNSNDPCDVFFQHCCTRSLPSGFRHFQPESTEDSCPPTQKIRGRPAKDPRSPCGRSTSYRTTIRRCPRGTTMEFLRKVKFFVSWTVYELCIFTKPLFLWSGELARNVEVEQYHHWSFTLAIRDKC